MLSRSNSKNKTTNKRFNPLLLSVAMVKWRSMVNETDEDTSRKQYFLFRRNIFQTPAPFYVNFKHTFISNSSQKSQEGLQWRFTADVWSSPCYCEGAFLQPGFWTVDGKSPSMLWEDLRNLRYSSCQDKNTTPQSISFSFGHQLSVIQFTSIQCALLVCFMPDTLLYFGFIVFWAHLLSILHVIIMLVTAGENEPLLID